MGAWVALIGGLAAAGATAYSASQRPDQPDPISYGDEYRKILNAQLKNAGRLYSAHAEWDPRYAGLDEQLLMQRLLGSPEGDHEEQYTEYVPGPPQYTTETVNWPGHGPITRRVPIPGTQSVVPVMRSHMVHTPATQGYLSLLENQLQPAARRLEAQDQRDRVGNELSILRDMGPDSAAAFRAANPGAGELIDELTKQANDELKLGSKLDPTTLQQVTESAREGQASRGMGFSPVDVFTEALTTGQAGEALKAARRSFAANTVQLNAGYFGDPYMKFFGRSSGETPNAGNFAAYGTSGTRAPFNPESPMAQDIIGANFNAAQSDYINGQNQFNQTMGAGMGVFGNALSSYILAQRNGTPALSPNNIQGGYAPSRNNMSGLQFMGAGGGMTTY